jgi:pyridoxal phosphate enzyme (YggS family)
MFPPQNAKCFFFLIEKSDFTNRFDLMLLAQNLQNVKTQLPGHVQLIAVSKTKPAQAIMELYTAGQRAFGENYVQELTEKEAALPKDIEWHFIGHLQSNKVKYIAPFVAWIHSVDSHKLLLEINKQAAKNNRIVHCLLQVHVAMEETKFGWDKAELLAFASNTDFNTLTNVNISGIMGMASFTDNEKQVRSEFAEIKNCFDALKTGPMKNHPNFNQISMGMSGDWQWAVEEGSTMVRIGSAIFGTRK